MRRGSSEGLAGPTSVARGSLSLGRRAVQTGWAVLSSEQASVGSWGEQLFKPPALLMRGGILLTWERKDPQKLSSPAPL